jgi:hypothetical protein
MLAPGELPTDRRTGATPPGAVTIDPEGPPGAGRRARDGLGARLRRLPKAARLGIAGGLAAVVLLATVAAASIFGGDGKPVAHPSAAPATTGPPFAVKAFSDSARGYTIDYPAEWTPKPSNSSYTDFVDPKDGGRRLRANRESAGSTPAAFLLVVERNLKDPKKGTCPAPYQRVALREDTGPVAGHASAELEYTCGQGASMRHGIWRALIADGYAYSFNLSVEDNRFTESKAIYDHAAESYQLKKPA